MRNLGNYFVFSFFSILLLISCGGGGGGGSSESGGSTSIPGIASTNLSVDTVENYETLTKNQKQSMLDDGFTEGTNRTTILKESQLYSMYELIEKFYKKVLAGGSVDISSEFRTKLEAYKLEPFIVKSGQTHYFGLREKSPRSFGHGFFLIRSDIKSIAKKYVIEVPHPLHDSNTPELGGEFIDAFKPAIYIQTGQHRNTSTTISPESFPGNQTSSLSYKATDVAHNSRSFFHFAHIVLSKDAELVIQLHGYGSSQTTLYSASPPIEVVLSAGSKTVVPSYLTSLKQEFTDRGVEAAVFPTDASKLGAQANVQGAHIRASMGNKFLHIETRTELRASKTERKKIIDALIGIL